MKKSEIIKNLKKLDSNLSESVELTICGGASVILLHGSMRTTEDIDVLHSIPKLSKISEGVKDRSIFELINDGVKGFSDLLDSGYKKRRVKIDYGFKNLKVYSIAKVDLFIMKLASQRVKDLEDISEFKMTKSEMIIVERALNRIATFDAGTAMKMDNFIKEYF